PKPASPTRVTWAESSNCSPAKPRRSSAASSIPGSSPARLLEVCFVLYAGARVRQTHSKTRRTRRTLMRRALWLAGLLAGLSIFAMERRPRGAVIAAPANQGPEFTSDGRLIRPANYRKWVFLSSGYGMSYSQKASDDPDHLMFTNVFVPPANYDYFLQHGAW